MKRLILLVAMIMLSAGSMQVATAAQEKQQVYGWELMTEQERMEHRNKMRSMKTQEERERYRAEHHARMQKRAQERGVTLPDMPGGPGKGMGKCGAGGKGGGPAKKCGAGGKGGGPAKKCGGK